MENKKPALSGRWNGIAKDFSMEFANAIRAAGLTPPDNVIADGCLHRFPTNGRRTDDSGWYVFHADGIPAGAFGDWRAGISQTWRADLGRPLTPEEQAEQRWRIENAKRQAEEDRRRRAEQAAALAADVWKAATPAGADHPYLTRKGVKPTQTLREIDAVELAERIGYTPRAKGEPLRGRVLLAPVRVDGKLSTLEMIDEQGRKSALAGGAKRGGYWATAPLPDKGRVVLCEGVATALSIAEALGEPVAAALSVGNLQAAGEAIRAAKPGIELVLAADLDKTAGKPHPEAVKAAEALGCRLAIPDFGPDRKPGDTDFNDLHAAFELNAVREAFAFLTAPNAESIAPEAIVGTLLSEVVKQDVVWLWRGWVPRGCLTMVAGHPGVGKSFLSQALAAAVTTGAPMPGDDTRREPANVILISCEDDLACTLRPRLEAMGADLTRIVVYQHVRKRRIDDTGREVEEKRSLVFPGDARLLADMIRKYNAALVVIDPLVAVQDGAIDSHRQAAMRQVLAPLHTVAQETGAAIVVVAHLRKSAADLAMLRVGGSVDLVAAARTVIVVATDPEDQASNPSDRRRIAAVAKSNIAAFPSPVAYTLRDGRFMWDTAPVSPALTADRLLETPAVGSEERGALEEAMDFLRQALADGPRSSKEVQRDAVDAGIEERTLRRARERLGVRVTRQGFGRGGTWVWSLAIDDHLPSIDAIDGQAKNLGHLCSGLATYGSNEPIWEGDL